MSQTTEQPGRDSGADRNGDDEEAKSGAGHAADAIDKDDPHKAEKLSKLGHPGDEAAEGTE